MGYPFIALYGAFPPHRRSVYLALDHKVDGGQSGLDILVNNIVVGGGEYFNRYSLLSEALGGVQVLCTEVWDRRCASLRLVLPPGHWPSGAPAPVAHSLRLPAILWALLSSLRRHSCCMASATVFGAAASSSGMAGVKSVTNRLYANSFPNPFGCLLASLPTNHFS